MELTTNCWKQLKRGGICSICVRVWLCSSNECCQFDNSQFQVMIVLHERATIYKYKKFKNFLWAIMIYCFWVIMELSFGFFFFMILVARREGFGLNVNQKPRLGCDFGVSLAKISFNFLGCSCFFYFQVCQCCSVKDHYYQRFV